ncbi:PITH domain-containing protein 1 [Phytophthora boehmeriae]|uniref:PITH domain-containing protein 1 n=1 Tax=Phytophthora boehmeriae TaxID=109152 RepID=A0A8T1WUG4_9STRA|nr:PITH domain-containing protein 1 [Phytophthora boehmeriae]
MQHCHDDHAQLGGHDHDHDHNHDHEDDVEDANGDSLYPFIDTSKVRVLNALDPQTAAHPFKPFHERQDRTRFLASNDDDPEMILFIPFTEAVSIKSICISGAAGDGTHPKEVKLFTNREDIDFSNANELPEQQKLDLIEDDTANVDYPLQVRKFQGVSNVTLFIQNSHGGDETRVYYIGLKGESKKWRHGVVECVYESRPQPSDHKVEDTIGSTSLI